MVSPVFLKKLEKKYSKDLKVFGLIQSKGPVIVHSEKFPVPTDYNEEYQQFVNFFENSGRVDDGDSIVNRNEPHAVLKVSFVLGEGMKVECYETDYAMCQLFREKLEKEFELITGNAVVYCSETKEIVVQFRAKGRHLYPEYLSIFGGGYLPRSHGDKQGDKNCIFNCIRREFGEESGARGYLDHVNAPILVTKELIGDTHPSGSIQFNAIGMSITEENLNLLEETWEGSVRRISLSSLGSSLKSDKWVPFARASIETWITMNKGLFSKKDKVLEYLSGKEFGGLLDNLNKVKKISKVLDDDD